jgi:hypothetical protein
MEGECDSMKLVALGCFLGFVFTFLFTLYQSQLEKSKVGTLPFLSKAKYRKMYVSSFVFLGIFIIALAVAKGAGVTKQTQPHSDPAAPTNETMPVDHGDDDKGDKTKKGKRKHPRLTDWEDGEDD